MKENREFVARKSVFEEWLREFSKQKENDSKRRLGASERKKRPSAWVQINQNIVDYPHEIFLNSI